MNDITIVMPTFNKEKYIVQALDSVFAQKTSYSFEIIIPDDHSTDETLSIIQDYQNKYPAKITLLTSDINQKLYKNVIRAYAQLKTPYFCVLDPDDYWTDPLHLQKALDFLASHPDYTIYCSDILKLYPNGTQTPCQFASHPTTSTFMDFLNNKSTLAFTQSTVFRNIVFSKGLPKFMQQLPSKTAEKSFRGDTFRNLIHLHEGKAYYVPEIQSVYRITEEGIWAGSIQMERELLNANIFKDMWLYFDKQYPELLVKSYLAYGKLHDILTESLSQIHDRNKLLAIIRDLVWLSQIYGSEKKALIRSMYSMLKLKDKFRLFCYLKLKYKLQSKGLFLY